MRRISFCWFVLIYIFLIFSNGFSKRHGKRECGIPNKNETVEEKIVGGIVAGPHEYPWMVSIQVNIKGKLMHNCGAAVIHSQFALTAAHCTQNIPIKNMKLVAGKINMNEKNPAEQYRDIKTIKTNSYDKKSYKNDIALIQVKKPFELNQVAVAPICLPKEQDRFRGKAVAAGWGRLEADGQLPNELMKVILQFIDKNHCKNLYEKAGYKYYLHECQICTLDYKGEKDACQGDSGGPLMCLDRNDKMYVCGVVSFGVGCANENHPGVYTEVVCFTKWIEDEINKNKY